ncbi:MAG: flagellar basal body rod protein FlgC [Bdellovibrionales bacterium]
MQSEILNAMSISASGMRTQGTRIRVIAENIANADTTGDTPGADPYRRQTITFKNELDRELGIKKVMVDDISVDRESPFKLEYQPDHPAADESGYVKMPNVNQMVEMMDIREAQRSYEANLGIIEQSRNIAMRTVDLLRS